MGFLKKYISNKSIVSKDTEDLKNKFDKLKNTEIPQARYKIVNLRMITGCGCGGSYTDVHMQVPESDNKYYNGETVDGIELVDYVSEHNYDLKYGHYNGSIDNYNADDFRSY